jgi:hypothetical protein
MLFCYKKRKEYILNNITSYSTWLIYSLLQITSFLVLEEAPPILLIAIGLDNGSIYCIKGDIARERITRFPLQVEAVSGGTSSPITGLGFRVEGQAHQLFAVTPSAITLFSLHHQPPRRQTLDQIGCEINAVAMSDRMVSMASFVFCACSSVGS